jgi:hypothetical protein
LPFRCAGINAHASSKASSGLQASQDRAACRQFKNLGLASVGG